MIKGLTENQRWRIMMSTLNLKNKDLAAGSGLKEGSIKNVTRPGAKLSRGAKMALFIFERTRALYSGQS